MKKKCILLFLMLFLEICLNSCMSKMPNYAILGNNMLDNMQSINEGEARITFFRANQEGMHSVGQILVYDGDALIGVLPNSSYFTLDVKPGKHIFGSYHENTMDFLKADIIAGKTYYVRCSRYVRFAANNKIEAIKKGSKLLSDLNDIIPILKRSELNELGIKKFTVRTSKSKKFFTDKPGFVTFEIEIENLRNQWLKKSEVSQKPMLLKEDGL
jgi:hypothetical protein